MRDALLGLVIGDALGVPVEFFDRDVLKAEPVAGMREYGTHDQPKGTWSDDSSMMLCLMESLTHGLNYEDQMSRFFRWANEGYMTPNGEVFDMGRATITALQRYAHGTPALECGCSAVNENGNGSLMRILPLAFFLRSSLGNDFPEGAEAYEIIHNCSALTHAHPISKMACGIYCSVINELTDWKALKSAPETQARYAVQAGIEKATAHYRSDPDLTGWLPEFRRVDLDTLMMMKEGDIQSSGYVISTLEAAIWCVLHTSSFESCLLSAVNLGSDTDTVCAVAGGLAGCVYPVDSLPKDWVDSIVGRDKIMERIIAFEGKLRALEQFRS